MGKRNKSENSTATSEPQQTIDGITETKSVRYVVVREGYRVSDREYDDPLDPLCVIEVQVWTKVAQNHSYGEKVEVVQYDSRKHRIW